MEYSVYILRNKNRRHYIGISGDVSKRLKQPNEGDVRSTRFKSSFEERNKILVVIDGPIV